MLPAELLPGPQEQSLPTLETEQPIENVTSAFENELNSIVGFDPANAESLSLQDAERGWLGSGSEAEQEARRDFLDTSKGLVVGLTEFSGMAGRLADSENPNISNFVKLKLDLLMEAVEDVGSKAPGSVSAEDVSRLRSVALLELNATISGHPKLEQAHASLIKEREDQLSDTHKATLEQEKRTSLVEEQDIGHDMSKKTASRQRQDELRSAREMRQRNVSEDSDIAIARAEEKADHRRRSKYGSAHRRATGSKGIYGEGKETTKLSERQHKDAHTESQDARVTTRDQLLEGKRRDIVTSQELSNEDLAIQQDESMVDRLKTHPGAPGEIVQGPLPAHKGEAQARMHTGEVFVGAIRAEDTISATGFEIETTEKRNEHVQKVADINQESATARQNMEASLSEAEIAESQAKDLADRETARAEMAHAKLKQNRRSRPGERVAPVEAPVHRDLSDKELQEEAEKHANGGREKRLSAARSWLGKLGASVRKAYQGENYNPTEKETKRQEVLGEYELITETKTVNGQEVTTSFYRHKDEIPLRAMHEKIDAGIDFDDPEALGIMDDFFGKTTDKALEKVGKVIYNVIGNPLTIELDRLRGEQESEMTAVFAAMLDHGDIYSLTSSQSVDLISQCVRSMATRQAQVLKDKLDPDGVQQYIDANLEERTEWITEGVRLAIQESLTGDQKPLNEVVEEITRQYAAAEAEWGLDGLGSLPRRYDHSAKEVLLGLGHAREFIGNDGKVGIETDLNPIEARQYLLSVYEFLQADSNIRTPMTKSAQDMSNEDLAVALKEISSRKNEFMHANLELRLQHQMTTGEERGVADDIPDSGDRFGNMLAYIESQRVYSAQPSPELRAQLIDYRHIKDMLGEYYQQKTGEDLEDIPVVGSESTDLEQKKFIGWAEQHLPAMLEKAQKNLGLILIREPDQPLFDQMAKHRSEIDHLARLYK